MANIVLTSKQNRKCVCRMCFAFNLPPSRPFKSNEFSFTSKHNIQFIINYLYEWNYYYLCLFTSRLRDWHFNQVFSGKCHCHIFVVTISRCVKQKHEENARLQQIQFFLLPTWIKAFDIKQNQMVNAQSSLDGTSGTLEDGRVNNKMCFFTVRIRIRNLFVLKVRV